MPPTRSASERVAFIRRTYGHLAGAILAFVAIEAFLFNFAPPEVVETIVRSMIGSRFSWLFVMGGFMLVSWLATSWAQSDSSVGLQYLGLSLYVVAQAILFVPILFVAQYAFPDDHLITKAGIMTLAVFGGLTVAVLRQRQRLLLPAHLPGRGKLAGLRLHHCRHPLPL